MGSALTRVLALQARNNFRFHKFHRSFQKLQQSDSSIIEMLKSILKKKQIYVVSHQSHIKLKKNFEAIYLSSIKVITTNFD